jgi:hypothetical protein
MRGLRWLQGVLFGFVVGAAILEVPGLGMLVALLCLLWATLDGTRPSGMGGLLLGLGGSMAVLIGAADARCAAFNAVPDQGCTAPDLTPDLVVAGVLVALGAVLTALSIRRSRGDSTGRTPRSDRR